MLFLKRKSEIKQKTCTQTKRENLQRESEKDASALKNILSDINNIITKFMKEIRRERGQEAGKTEHGISKNQREKI